MQHVTTPIVKFTHNPMCHKCDSHNMRIQHAEGALELHCKDCGYMTLMEPEAIMAKEKPSYALDGSFEIVGVGPDAPVVTNDKGASQSAIPYRFDLIDPLALFNMAYVLHQGAEKYGEDNWRGLSIETNINSAISHLYAYLAHDTQDDHLGHAFCRVMFALALHLEIKES